MIDSPPPPPPITSPTSLRPSDRTSSLNFTLFYSIGPCSSVCQCDQIFLLKDFLSPHDLPLIPMTALRDKRENTNKWPSQTLPLIQPRMRILPWPSSPCLSLFLKKGFSCLPCYAASGQRSKRKIERSHSSGADLYNKGCTDAEKEDERVCPSQVPISPVGVGGWGGVEVSKL